MVEEIKLKEKVTGDKNVNCDLCVRNDQAIALCSDCSVFLCNHCHESHKYSREYQGHRMMQLNELKIENKDVINLKLKPKIPICQKHELELNFYCDTCERLVCHYCITKHHFNHKHTTAKDAANKCKLKLDKTMEPVEKLLNKLSEGQQNITMTREWIEKQTVEAGKQINRHYKLLQRRLQQQRVELLKELYNVSAQKQNVLWSQLSKMENIQARVESVKELCITVMCGSDQEALFMEKQIIQNATRLTDTYKRLRVQPIEQAAMQFVPVEKYHKWFPQFGNVFYGDASAINSEVKDFPSIAYINGFVEFEIQTKDAENRDCYCYEGNSSKVVVEAEYSTGDVPPVTVFDKEDGSYSAYFDLKKFGEVKVSVVIQGKHIKGSPSHVVVHRNYKELDDMFSNVIDDGGTMGHPWGIAFDQSGMWAVADHSNNCVCIFDVQDQLVRKFGSKGKGKGQLNSPTALAFDASGHLYVVDRGNQRVQKFNVDGKCLQEIGCHSLMRLFGGFKSDCDKLSDPVGITIHNDKVFVTDQGKLQVFIFKCCNGQYCSVIGKGFYKVQLKEPYDVAVNINNQVLVADHGHGCIFVFTLDGGYINTIGTEILGKGRLKFPSSIITDECGLIFVTLENGVIIFDQYGYYVHSFGSKGSEYGQFLYPSGVALSPNGKVYVSDRDNKKIQIFSYLRQ